MEERNKKRMGYIGFILLLLCMAVTGYLIYDKFGSTEAIIIEPVKTDTVIISEIKEVPKIPEERKHIPKRVEIQKEPDTLYRQEVEKLTIITGVEIKDSQLEVTTVDTSGNQKK